MSFFLVSCNNVIKKKFYKEMLVSSLKRDNQTVGDFFFINKRKKIYFQEFESFILFYSGSLEFYLVLYKYISSIK